MESSIFSRIKKNVQKVIDTKLLKHGSVLDVRDWPNSAMIEIDLHLPGADMLQWSSVPYIKFQVTEFTFRDYTPFGWDADTSTCSILVDAAHHGPGSNWARKLKSGDAVQYLKIDSSKQAPHGTNMVVGLGDNTSIAHLMALQQLTLPVTRFEGALATDNTQTKSLLSDYFSYPIYAHLSDNELMIWLSDQGYCTQHTSFYLTGHEQLVIRLRKALRNLGHANIHVKSFWS